MVLMRDFQKEGTLHSNVLFDSHCQSLIQWSARSIYEYFLCPEVH